MEYRCLFGILLLVWVFIPHSDAACVSVPLSLSSAGVCENGVCEHYQLVESNIKVEKSASACFRLDQSEIEASDRVVNITFNVADLFYPLHNCYMSADPQMFTTGYCACDFISPVDCSHCPAGLPHTYGSFCVDSLNRGTGCYLTTGSGCVRVGFTAAGRYKICKIGKPKLEVAYEAFDGTSFANGFVELLSPTKIALPQASFTFTSITNIPEFRSGYTVLDMFNPTLVYFVDEDRINSYTETDPSKLGWYKTASNLTYHHMAKDTVTQLRDCPTNDFIVSVSSLRFDEFLTDKHLLQNIMPGSLLADGDAAQVQNGGVFYDPPLQPILSGIALKTEEGLIAQYGVNPAVEFLQSGDNAFYGADWGPIQMNGGLVTGNWSLACSDGFTFNRRGASWAEFYTVYQCNQVGPGVTNWGICVKRGNTPMSLLSKDCAGPWFLDLANSNTGATVTFASSTEYGIMNITLSPEWNSTGWLGDWGQHLLVNPIGIESTLTVKMKNVTIEFEATNIKPEIKLIDDSNKEFLKVDAKSNSVRGNCLFISSDNLFSTQMVDLGLETHSYKLPYIVGKFDGETVLTLQCYNNKDSVKFKLKFENGDPIIKYDSINSTGIRDATIDKSLWTLAKDGAGGVGGWFKDTFSTIFSLTDSTIGSFFLGVFILIIIGFALFFGIPILVGYLVKLSKYMFMKIANKFKRRNSMIPMFKTQ